MMNKIIWKKQVKNKKVKSKNMRIRVTKCLICNNKMLDFMAKCWTIKTNNNIRMKKINNKNKI